LVQKSCKHKRDAVVFNELFGPVVFHLLVKSFLFSFSRLIFLQFSLVFQLRWQPASFVLFTTRVLIFYEEDSRIWIAVIGVFLLFTLFHYCFNDL
jgi:hypothetical protein